MRYIFAIFSIVCLSCVQNTQSHPPVGGFLSEKDLATSKNRAKNLNLTERAQIQDWINNHSEAFYPMSLNYWVNLQDLNMRTRKVNGDTVSYQYDIYDFDLVKLYEEPTKNSKVQLGRFDEIKAVEDALRYLNTGEEAMLLIPSVLAFGTYGDNNKIPNDMPLIIKLKVL